MYADALIIMHSLSRHTVDDMYTKNKSKRKERKLLSDLRGGRVYTHKTARQMAIILKFKERASACYLEHEVCLLTVPLLCLSRSFVLHILARKLSFSFCLVS